MKFDIIGGRGSANRKCIQLVYKNRKHVSHSQVLVTNNGDEAALLSYTCSESGRLGVEGAARRRPPQRMLSGFGGAVFKLPCDSFKSKQILLRVARCLRIPHWKCGADLSRERGDRFYPVLLGAAIFGATGYPVTV